jgi:hypothetical protein
MNVFRVIAATIGLLFPVAQLSAAPPFEIDGLHVHLAFEEAVARAEELGGVCQLGTLRRGEVVTAQCEYASCGGEGNATPCPEAEQGARPFAVVAQPVLRIGLEAPAGAPGLTRVSFIYEGDSQVVKESLLNRYGQPAGDSSEFTGKSWSHARRMQWRSGGDALGLLMTNKVVTLTTTAPGGESGPAPGD